MGMLREGNALSENFGPSMGRGLGLAADADRSTSNLVAQAAGHSGHGAEGAMDMYPKDDPEKKKVPGYPQDMWMPMDEMFAGKPELYGLRKGWSGAMMGMMTLVRVLPAEVYDKIMDLKAAERASPRKGKEMPHHQHGK